MHPAQQLYRLQEIDMSLAAVGRRLGEIAANLGETEELQIARQAVHFTEAELQRWQVLLRQRELEVKGLNSKIKARKDRLYAGRVRNPKELKNLQEELHSLRRRLVAMEDALLEAMLQVEQFEEVYATRQDRLARVSEAWQAAQEALLAEQTELQARRRQLLTQRQEQATTAGANLRLYEDLRRRKAGRPVALLGNGACQACGMALPTGEAQRVKYGQDVCLCSSCGRVLWAG